MLYKQDALLMAWQSLTFIYKFSLNRMRSTRMDRIEHWCNPILECHLPDLLMTLSHELVTLNSALNCLVRGCIVVYCAVLSCDSDFRLNPSFSVLTAHLTQCVFPPGIPISSHRPKTIIWVVTVIEFECVFFCDGAVTCPYCAFFMPVDH